MLKDLASQKKSDKDIILAAINSLKAKGWHINPYTVADEARISRSVIVRSPEYMDMVSKARGKAVATPNQISDELMRQVDLLEEENRGLKDRLSSLTQQAELLAQAVRDAFQQGYNTAKAEMALASGLKDIVRGGTADSGEAAKPANDFSSHVPHSQLYTNQGYDQGYAGSLDQSAQYQPSSYYQQDGGSDQTTDYPRPGAQAGYSAEYGNGPVLYEEESLHDPQYEEQSEQSCEEDPLHGTPPHSQQVFAGESYDDQSVETADHDVFIASHIPQLHEESGIVDAFSARLMAALNTEEEGEAANEGIDGELRYDTGEFAETDIPDWDALAMAPGQEEAWEEDESINQADVGLSAVGSSIPPLQEPDKPNFNPDDLRQLVNNQLEGTPGHEEAPEASAPHPQPAAPSASKRFVGSNRQSDAPISAAPVSRMVPPEIRKACLILGIKSDEITRENVNRAWKSEMAKPGVHPDTGGDTEIAIYINNAKESLMKWLDMQAPKLGKKFGPGGPAGGPGGKPK
jgi:hypothetical protein